MMEIQQRKDLSLMSMKKEQIIRRYEEIGLIMDKEVYHLLETQGGLERLEVGSESFIFCSPEIRTKERIVILIHGRGVVRAGQWARRLIINEVRMQEHCPRK